MAVKTLQVTHTGSAVRVATARTYARWVVFQNNSGAIARIGDGNVSSTVGIALPAIDIANSVLTLQPMPDGSHYDLSQWYTIGTAAQLLDIVYDAMN